MQYRKFTLGELVAIRYGKSQKTVLSESGSVPIYGTGGLMGYSTRALYEKPSVLIGRKGTINKVRYVDHPFWTVDTLFYTEVNEKIIKPKYLYYLMSQINLDTYNEGTTIPSLRTETLNRIEFDVPNLDYQTKVLSILDPFDGKIRLNEAINENLTRESVSPKGREIFPERAKPAPPRAHSAGEAAGFNRRTKAMIRVRVGGSTTLFLGV